MEPPAPTIAPPASSSPDATFTPPAEFDDYVIVRALGAGRMGHVYLAEDTVLARAVSIKFIAGVPVVGTMDKLRELADAFGTETGCELITRDVPVKADEIEALMRG